MTFDEQLKRTFDTLTDRLHAELTRQIQSAMDELGASAHADRDRAAAETHDSADSGARDAHDAAAATVRTEHQPSDSGASERLVDAVRSIDRARSLSEVLDTLVRGAAAEAPRVAVLLVRGGRFRVWRAVGFGPAIDEGPSIDVTFANGGIATDALRRGSTASGDRAPSFVSAAGLEQIAIPMAISGDVVAVLYADQGPAHTLEVMARHAARCLESLTAFKTARALVRQPDDPQSRPGDEISAEEDAAARRYARLLVSEIKLYHEAAVVTGRHEHDLATRLGGEIARARVLYEQRVPVHVRERADHFHDELVRTLANGDASLLDVRT